MRCLTYVLGLLFVGGATSINWNVDTPLDEYVNRDDGFYVFSEIATYDNDPDFTVHVLNMTSQKWMDEAFSETPVWWHYLSVFIPKDTVQDVITDAAFLFIGGGNHNDSVPTMEENWMRRMGEYSRNMKVVTAFLKCVPYQPIRFPDSLVGRTEDLIIGYTWKLFIEDPDIPDPDIVVLLPMVKAAKKALDTIATFTTTKDPKYQITKFVPSGFSKRGWTTWLLGAVDPRVIAMAPTVFDLLNFQDNLEHHYRGLGGWSWAFFPYWIEDVSKYLYHPRTSDIGALIDPLSYVERLTMPKLLICASQDQFFPPTGTHYWWDQMGGDKYFQIWENDDHGLSGHLDRRDASVQAFFLSVYHNIPLPKITWLRQQNADAARISVTTDTRPSSVLAWMADTSDVTCEPDADAESVTCRRDFRARAAASETNTTWSAGSVLDLGQGQYFVAYDKPSFGYRGFFVQMTFPGPNGFEMTFTSEVNVIPDDFPYPKCETEEECKGRLV